MLEQAQKIVEEFEKDIPELYDPRQLDEHLETVALYLAAKAYLARFK